MEMRPDEIAQAEASATTVEEPVIASLASLEPNASTRPLYFNLNRMLKMRKGRDAIMRTIMIRKLIMYIVYNGSNEDLEMFRLL